MQAQMLDSNSWSFTITYFLCQFHLGFPSCSLLLLLHGVSGRDSWSGMQKNGVVVWCFKFFADPIGHAPAQHVGL
jgi:hypothetical protein